MLAKLPTSLVIFILGGMTLVLPFVPPIVLNQLYEIVSSCTYSPACGLVLLPFEVSSFFLTFAVIIAFMVNILRKRNVPNVPMIIIASLLTMGILVSVYSDVLKSFGIGPIIFYVINPSLFLLFPFILLGYYLVFKKITKAIFGISPTLVTILISIVIAVGIFLSGKGIFISTKAMKTPDMQKEITRYRYIENPKVFLRTFTPQDPPVNLGEYPYISPYYPHKELMLTDHINTVEMRNEGECIVDRSSYFDEEWRIFWVESEVQCFTSVGQRTYEEKNQFYGPYRAPADWDMHPYSWVDKN